MSGSFDARASTVIDTTQRIAETYYSTRPGGLFGSRIDPDELRHFVTRQARASAFELFSIGDMLAATDSDEDDASNWSGRGRGSGSGLERGLGLGLGRGGGKRGRELARRPPTSTSRESLPGGQEWRRSGEAETTPVDRPSK